MASRDQAAASRHDNPEDWVSGGHERFETPVIPVRDGEHPAATRPEWWREKEPPEALFFICHQLQSLIWGIDSDRAQEECEQAAAVWMNDARTILAEWKAGWGRWVR